MYLLLKLNIEALVSTPVHTSVTTSSFKLLPLLLLLWNKCKQTYNYDRSWWVVKQEVDKFVFSDQFHLNICFRRSWYIHVYSIAKLKLSERYKCTSMCATAPTTMSVLKRYLHTYWTSRTVSLIHINISCNLWPSNRKLMKVHV